MSQSGFNVLPGDIATQASATQISLASGVVPIDQYKFNITHAGVLKRAGYNGSSLASSVLWVDAQGARRYEPHLDDMVVGIIMDKGQDKYTLDLGGMNAILSQTGFDGASRRNKPTLDIGDIVYCRISMTNKYIIPHVTCTTPSGIASRDWSTGEGIFGPLLQGTLIYVSLSLSHYLMASGSDDAQFDSILDQPATTTNTTTMSDGGDEQQAIPAQQQHILDIIGDKIAFEIAIGINGIIWVKSSNIRHTIIICNVIRKFDQDRSIDVNKMLTRALKVLDNST